MRYQELYDWEQLSASNFVMPKMSGSYIDKASCGRGTYHIYVDINIPQKYYWAIDPNTNIPICFIGLLQFGKYYMIKNAFSSIQGKGLATSLIDYVIDAENTMFFSDTQMSLAGEALTRKLEQRSLTRIVNLNTLEIFDKTDVNQKQSNDGEMVTHPKNDTRTTPQDFGNIQHNEQRWVFVFENIITETKKYSSNQPKLLKFDVPEKGYSKDSLLIPLVRYTEGP